MGKKPACVSDSGTGNIVKAIKKIGGKRALVAHACNPSYLGG
jgi:hypothetical protein